jgi:Double-GTPase 2
VILVYLLLLWPYLLSVSLLIPGVALLTAAGYAVAIPGCYVVGLVQVLAIRPDELAPPRWFPKRPEDGEPAELGYFYGPAFAEVEQVATVAFKLARDLAKSGIGLVRSSFEADLETKRLITVPLGIGGAVGMVAGAAFGAVGFAGVAVVHAVVAAMALAAMRVTGLALLVIDSGLLRIKNIRMSCPHCFERVAYPSYKCPGCARLHKDIRPGRYGNFRRRCLCGIRLPTLLLLGSARLPAYCPHEGCLRSMEHRPGEAQEIVLPFFGASGAGKTRLMYGIVTLLRSTAGLDTEFADSATDQDLADVARVLAPSETTARTSRALPRGQVLRVKSGGGTRLLQMFDGAGERFYHSDTTQELGYLTKARTFVLVIDPLSIDHLWASLPAERRDELLPVRSDAPSPELGYQQTHQQMEAMGVRLKKARLAVVFSRADLLDLPGGEPVREWARDALGLGNLVRSVRHEFGETGFFRTASVLQDDGRLHPSMMELTRWLVTSAGITLPEQLDGMIR